MYVYGFEFEFEFDVCVWCVKIFEECLYSKILPRVITLIYNCNQYYQTKSYADSYHLVSFCVPNTPVQKALFKF